MIQFEFELIGIDEQIYDNFKTFTLELGKGSEVEIRVVNSPLLNARNIYSVIICDGKSYYSIEDAQELGARLQNLLKENGQGYANLTDDTIDRLTKIKEDMKKAMEDMQESEAKFEKMKSKKNKIVRFQMIVWGLIYILCLLGYIFKDIQPSNILLLFGVVSIILNQLNRELIK